MHRCVGRDEASDDGGDGGGGGPADGGGRVRPVGDGLVVQREAVGLVQAALAHLGLGAARGDWRRDVIGRCDD